MKYFVFIILMTLTPLCTFAQTELVIDARPTAMGYCTSANQECNGKITSIGTLDVSGYLLKISFKKDKMIKLKLFKNGELIEDIYSVGFNSVKVSKRFWGISCNHFQLNKLFHNPSGANATHSLFVDISLKKKTGKVSFHYPEESRMFIYLFNLL